MLVSYEWLKDHINDPDLIILDTRPTIAYSYGHLENSISLTIESVITIDQYGSNLVADSKKIAKTLGNMGINETKTLVVVGEYMDPSHARIAWTLQYLGHKKINFLTESFGDLQRKGVKFTRKPFNFPPTNFMPTIDDDLRIKAEILNENLENVTLLDARSPQEFIHGHLPHSILLPFTDGIGKNGELFLPKEELEKLFEEKNIAKDKEIVCYCMHGHRASSLFYQLKIAGFEQIKLYDGSFIEWYGRGFPLE